VSNVRALEEAQVSVTHHAAWDQVGGTQKLVELQQRAYRSRGFGDFWQHMLVAEGNIDAAVDAIGLEPYDTAAVCLVVREAGGMFTDRLGATSFRNGSAVTSNGHLHSDVLNIIRC
jgi:histidinol-phosphatase